MSAANIKVTSLVFPFAVALEIRTVAAHTLLTNAEIAETFNINEMMVGMFLRANAVQVNLFWEEIRHGKPVGMLHVTTILGEITIGRYKTWGSFWQAAAENNWLYREDFRPLNSPNLPAIAPYEPMGMR